MKPQIRPFNDDYEAMAFIENTLFPEKPRSAEALRHEDTHWDPKCALVRFVAEEQGEVIAFAEYHHMPGMFHPRKLWFSIRVLPEQQGRGIGKALYELVLDDLAQYDPLILRSYVRETMERGVRFMTDRGYREDKRDWDSKLDVPSFDPTPFAEVEAQVGAHGIVVKSLRELEADPEMAHKLYDLFCDVRLDVPRTEPPSPITFELWKGWNFDEPTFLPEAYFVALDGAYYVGMSALWASDGGNHLETGLTAVRRAYRGKHVALALKLRGIAYAKAQGRTHILTDNDSRNKPMLHINERLGFVRQPAWISFAKTLKEE